MKKPRLLNLAAGVSLLLAVAIIFLWVRGYGRSKVISCTWHTSTELRFSEVASRFGSISFRIGRVPDSGRPTSASYHYYDDPAFDPMDTLLLQWFPFPPVRSQRGLASRYNEQLWALTIADWLLLLLTLPLPLLALARHRRRRHRETNNLCPSCGYDLRATPDRCPECGAVPVASSVRASAAK